MVIVILTVMGLLFCGSHDVDTRLQISHCRSLDKSSVYIDLFHTDKNISCINLAHDYV